MRFAAPSVAGRILPDSTIVQELPLIIQGGMGAGVSNWRLARAVSSLGQLGVVSGTALDQILARRLQDGDPGGHMRRGLDHFPDGAMADRVWRAHYIPGGRPPSRPYRPLPLHAKTNPRELDELIVVSNFVEVYLAREGGHPVGINYLEKIQLPLLPSIYGAMLAGVDYVLMGAGIPLKIPGVLDQLARHEPATYPLAVAGSEAGDDVMLTFTPSDFVTGLPRLDRPRFVAIISSHVLAMTLLKRSNGAVNGFVIEGPTAGGHNAPPRGRRHWSDAGPVVYGERDVVDLDKMRALGVPFWLAGGYGDPRKLAEAIELGAAGVQVGTAFAFCEESGLRDETKHAIVQMAARGEARVVTDPAASPTSFPFKIAQLEGTLSEQRVYESRVRVCDLGYLREAFRQPDGTVGYRCSSEPASAYLSKGGGAEETMGRKCICNGLLANIGQAQVRGRHLEPGILTAGDDLTEIARFLKPGASTYSASEVIARVLNGPRE